MPNYRRDPVPGATYFFTIVTDQRHPWLCSDLARKALREAIAVVRKQMPFSIDAFALMPDHLHCIWTLPRSDSDFSKRWRLIKARVSRACADEILEVKETGSRRRRGERSLWQRRFWEHTIRDEPDLAAHYDYIHYNPVKHGLVSSPAQWRFSTFHRLVKLGVYPENWASAGVPEIPDGVGRE